MFGQGTYNIIVWPPTLSFNENLGMCQPIIALPNGTGHLWYSQDELLT